MFCQLLIVISYLSKFVSDFLIHVFILLNIDFLLFVSIYLFCILLLDQCFLLRLIINLGRLVLVLLQVDLVTESKAPQPANEEWGSYPLAKAEGESALSAGIRDNEAVDRCP